MLRTAPYTEQCARWPQAGQHILAHYTEDAIVVYQAYRPALGTFAATHGYFGGAFSLQRTSWIKPNFLWMMYRSNWGTAAGQEVVLAITLKRTDFDAVLQQAVHSTFRPAIYASATEWRRQLQQADVVMQWDPDHGPAGQPLARRAIQLGLRGATLAAYARDWPVSITDISPFVAAQRHFAQSDTNARLLTPTEDVYPIPDPALAQRLGITHA